MAYAARRPSATACDHGRGADAHVAGAEDARPAGGEGDRVGRQAPLLGGRRRPSAPRASQSSSGPLADGQQDAVALDDELGARPPAPGGAGRRRPARPGAMRWNSTPVTLLFSSVTTRVGAAWKMARAPSSMHLVDLVRGGHVLHVAAVDERHLRGALADRGARAVHRGEAAADDHDARARRGPDRAGRGSRCAGTRGRRGRPRRPRRGCPACSCRSSRWPRRPRRSPGSGGRRW